MRYLVSTKGDMEFTIEPDMVTGELSTVEGSWDIRSAEDGWTLEVFRLDESADETDMTPVIETSEYEAVLAALPGKGRVEL